MPPFCYQLTAVVLTRSQGQIPAICVAISFGIHTRRPSQAPRTALVVLGGLLPTLNCRKPIGPEPPIMCSYFAWKSMSGFRFAALQFPSPFARFIMSFVGSCFRCFSSILVTNKPIDKTTSISSSTCCTLRTNDSGKSWRNTNSDRTLDFTHAGIRLAFVCCSNSLLYTRIWYDRVVQCTEFQTPVIHVLLPPVSVAHHNRESVDYIALFTSISFVRVTLLLAVSTFKFVL